MEGEIVPTGADDVSPHVPNELLGKSRYLVEKIDRSLDQVRVSRRYNRRLASLLRILTVLLSTLGTILLGIQISGTETQFKQVAFVFGAIVTLLNALEPYFNFRSLWIEHESALAELYELKEEITYYLAGKEPGSLESGVISSFHERHQQIWRRLSKAWIEHRKSGIEGGAGTQSVQSAVLGDEAKAQE